MNYLSHFYYDQTEQRPDFVIGSVYPDLVSGYSRKLKAPAIDLTQEHNIPDSLIALQEGINRHHFIDKKFHSSDFFEDYTTKIKKDLLALELEGVERYYYFYAHILLELLLDRVLHKRYEGLADNFYNLVDKANFKTSIAYFEWKDLSEYIDEFKKYYNFFTTSKFVYKYQDNLSLAKALNKVHLRVNPQEMLPEDLDKIANAMDGMEQMLYDVDFNKIF